MQRRIFARFVVVGFAAASSACSAESPVVPDFTPDVGGLSASAKAAQGSYELSFYKSGPNGLEPVSTLSVLSEELILGAHVEDSAGFPAQKGNVTFQYCSLKGLPPNDITRADEAPSSECANGSAKWASLVTVPVNTSGDAYMNFGLVRIPRTVGFRFQYKGNGSIGSGTSAPADFTWVP